MSKLKRLISVYILAALILLMIAIPAFAYKVYRVRPGDNLQKIAVWYGVTPASLVKFNHLDNPGYIVAGQVLLIPEPSTKEDEKVYAVKSGDTLQKIARKYEVSLDWLFARNNLDQDSRIYVGQMIKIPAPPAGTTQPGKPKPGRQYVYNIPALMARHRGYLYLKGLANQKKVALTFDDGPDNNFTPRILDKLGAMGVKATFFLVGQKIPGNEWVVTRMIREGHIVGNHSYSHPNLRKLTVARITDEITLTTNRIQSIIHKYPLLVRPPYGEISESGFDWLVQKGYRVINWSVDSGDWRAGSSDQVLAKVLSQLKPGAIILFHSAGGTGEDLTPTVNTIVDLVNTLQALGYKIVPLSELIPVTAYR